MERLEDEVEMEGFFGGVCDWVFSSRRARSRLAVWSSIAPVVLRDAAEEQEGEGSGAFLRPSWRRMRQ